MERVLAAVTCLVLAGCARTLRFSAPAGADALDCARREAERLGYVPAASAEERGVLRMGLRIPPTPREQTRPLRSQAPPMADETAVPFNGELDFREGDGQLQVDVVVNRGVEGPAGTRQRITDDAQQVLNLCRSDAG